MTHPVDCGSTKGQLLTDLLQYEVHVLNIAQSRNIEIQGDDSKSRRLGHYA
jgi:hypothetical protein